MDDASFASPRCPIWRWPVGYDPPTGLNIPSFALVSLAHSWCCDHNMTPPKHNRKTKEDKHTQSDRIHDFQWIILPQTYCALVWTQMKQGSNSHINLRTVGSLASSKCSICWQLSRGGRAKKAIRLLSCCLIQKEQGHSPPSSPVINTSLITTAHTTNPNSTNLTPTTRHPPTVDGVFVERAQQKGWTKATT